MFFYYDLGSIFDYRKLTMGSECNLQFFCYTHSHKLSMCVEYCRIFNEIFMLKTHSRMPRTTMLLPLFYFMEKNF